MSWPPPRSTTGSTPTPLSGTGPTTRCVSGSPSMPPEFVARLRARPTRRTGTRRRPHSPITARPAPPSGSKPGRPGRGVAPGAARLRPATPAGAGGGWRRGRGWPRSRRLPLLRLREVLVGLGQQRVQGRDDPLQVFLAEVEVAQGGADVAVAEQTPQAGQVSAGLQQVGGVGVPQRVQA